MTKLDEDKEFVKMIQQLNEVATGKNAEGDPISNELGTQPMLFERQLVTVPEDQGVQSNAHTDYVGVRANILQLIADGQSGIEGLLQVATESQSPRAFEVLATYLKTVGELNSQLIGLHKDKAEIETEQIKNQPGMVPGAVATTNVFVGSTEELQKYLEGKVV